jgi:hypothetical protein
MTDMEMTGPSLIFTTRVSLLFSSDLRAAERLAAPVVPEREPDRSTRGHSEKRGSERHMDDHAIAISRAV